MHSTYMRRPADRPLGGRRMLLRLKIRRFFCDNDLCSRRTMAEQVPCLTTPYRRRTLAAARIMQAIGLGMGGRAGAPARRLPAGAGKPRRDRARGPAAPGPAVRPGHGPGDRRVCVSRGAPPTEPCSSMSRPGGPSTSCPTGPRTPWPPGSPHTLASRSFGRFSGHLRL
ncbi:hypothetical protein [Streptomyces sp. NBC_01351]|uniref:hypothetical protein n=1 Tax=Streptomyces sp. NBC_01351 TaxID=2903833 RepID=UPI003FCDAF4A